jgi:hypothetical protein
MTLNLESLDESSKKKSNSKYKAALGVGSVVSLFGIGSTLAANISLNGGGNVEFGQGVATTAACDEDGFSITPVTRYDNTNSKFRIDYIQVTGVNLTPEGTGWDDEDLSFASQDDAKEEYPGQYYDGTDWKNTCDGVVLDFKAYTDDVNFINRTVIDDAFNGNLQYPIGWYQHPTDTYLNYDPGFALVIDINNSGTNFDSNYAVDDSTSGDPDHMDWTMNDYSSPATSSFQFYVDSSYWDTDAASVSKITVQSMKEFPSSYYAYENNLGNPSDWSN